MLAIFYSVQRQTCTAVHLFVLPMTRLGGHLLRIMAVQPTTLQQWASDDNVAASKLDEACLVITKHKIWVVVIVVLPTHLLDRSGTSQCSP